MTVSETADALTVIRCGKRARQLDLKDPCAAWFVDETAQRMVGMVQATDRDIPTLVLAEGLIFFLPPPLTEKVLDPNWLPLARGSRLIFDCWTDPRIDTLNRRVQEKIGTGLFYRFPLPLDPPGLEDTLCQRGYHEITIEPLDLFTEVKDEFPESWLMVEAVR